MIPLNKIPRNECIFLDTNVLIFSTGNPDYKEAAGKLLQEFADRGNKLVVSHIVKYELLCRAKDSRSFRATAEVLSKFDQYGITEEILDATTKLHFLFGQTNETKQFAARELFRDFLIGCSAGKHTTEARKKTSILSGDHDFPLPYFHPRSFFPLQGKSALCKMQNLYLFDIDAKRINADWERQLDNSTKKGDDETDA